MPGGMVMPPVDAASAMAAMSASVMKKAPPNPADMRAGALRHHTTRARAHVDALPDG